MYSWLKAEKIDPNAPKLETNLEKKAKWYLERVAKELKRGEDKKN